MDAAEPEVSRAPRVPGALKGQIWIAPDFDDFTEQDEADWYGDEHDPLRT